MSNNANWCINYGDDLGRLEKEWCRKMERNGQRTFSTCTVATKRDIAICYQSVLHWRDRVTPAKRRTLSGFSSSGDSLRCNEMEWQFDCLWATAEKKGKRDREAWLNTPMASELFSPTARRYEYPTEQISANMSSNKVVSCNVRVNQEFI